MLARLIRWVLAPLALAVAFTTVAAPPSGAVTGPNIVKDFEHEYVGLVAFYDENNEFLHRCTGTLLSDEVFLTAGHCVDSGGTKHTHVANGNEVAIGPVHNYTFGPGGDMGIIRILDTGYWKPKAWVYVTASNGGYPTTKNESYTISGTGYSSALIGQYLCKTGKTSGTSCGKVEAIGVTVNYSSEGVTVHNLGRANIHICKGDSGGPLYVKHVAYGLVSGLRFYPGNNQCGDTLYYQGVKGAADAMNVVLLTA